MSAVVIPAIPFNELPRISGRRQVVGKPFVYRTTRDFLMHFGLQSLKDLPPLEEFEETFGSEPDLQMSLEEDS